MFFDVIFMVQHFCLYPAAAHGQFWPAAADDEEAAAAAARGAKRGSGGTPALPAPVRDAEAALGTSETDPMLVPTPQQPLPLR